MSKIKISKDQATVMLEAATYKINSLRGVRDYYDGDYLKHGIIVSTHNDKFKIRYEDKKQRDADLKLLGEIIAGTIDLG